MLICIPAHVVHVIPIKENVKRIQRYIQHIPALAKGMKVSVLGKRKGKANKGRATVAFLLNGHL